MTSNKGERQSGLLDIQEQLAAVETTEAKAKFSPKPWAVAILAALTSLTMFGLVVENLWLMLGGMAACFGSYWLLRNALRPRGVRQAMRSLETGAWWQDRPKYQVWAYMLIVLSPSVLMFARNISIPLGILLWLLCAILSYPALKATLQWEVPDA
ncbi:hypothetical protein WG915_02620 [Corynebacterium sp. H128]|uniref:hypothetical protein n=1 Tax=unclassified Corynebacterium TaxID=2624378 RepID=UPI0030B689C2